MKITRIGRVSGIALVGALALSACGSNDNSGGDDTADKGADTSAAAPGSDSAAPAGDAACGSGTLNASGSTAQKNAIEEAISSFKDKCSGLTVNYNDNSSGDGIKDFIAQQSQFAGSDSALKGSDGKTEVQDAAKACASPAWNIPMVTGPIAIAYNLKGVDKLVLTPALLSDIFNGKITKWNDPAIVAVNKDAKLPDTAIKPFFRSDDSGTTENFTKYLAGSAKDKWTAKPAKKWTGKGEGKAKTAGVASAVKTTDGGLGYIEWGSALDNQLGVAQIDNGAGAVELSGESAGKAVAAAKPDGEGNDLRLKLDYATKEAGAYPILLVTYEIVCSKYADPKVAGNVKSFLNHFSSDETQKSLQEIGYAPLPSEIRSKVATALTAVK